MPDLSSYHLGRELVQLQAPYGGCDKTYAAQRLDDEIIVDARFEHCTLSNLSFKGATVKRAHFLNCVFIGCYFRRAQFVDSRFVGCRFFDCNFAHVAVQSCDFRFSSFHSCQIPYAELSYSLPTEPNIREQLTRILSLESSRLGLSSEARLYRMAEIKAREEHLFAAFSGQSHWYREHFDFVGRVRCLGEWILSLFNRWLWGYGERSWVLIRNLLALSLFVFPALFYWFRDQFTHRNGDEPGLWDAINFSLQNVTPAGVVSQLVPEGPTVRFLAGFESLLAVVAVALFASYIFRWSLHR